MKNDYVFILTTGGARTNICADFKTFTYELFLKELKKETYGSWRISKMDGGESVIMSWIGVELFEELNLHKKLSKDEVEKLGFIKEIRLKYGMSGDRVKLKRIPKKDLIVGGLYEQSNGEKVLYLGKVEVKHPEYQRSYSQEIKYTHEIEVGYGYYSIYESESIDIKDRAYSKGGDYMRRPTVVKSPRKLIKYLDRSCVVPKSFSKKRSDTSYIDIKFFDA